MASTHDLAVAVVEEVIENLMRRKGFDDWWEGIDIALRRDMRRELTDVVEATVVEEMGL